MWWSKQRPMTPGCRAHGPRQNECASFVTSDSHHQIKQMSSSMMQEYTKVNTDAKLDNCIHKV
jgi:hypothetical protein